MVVVRNELLGVVRQLSPERFLSVDSDILLAGPAIPRMLDAIVRRRWDACGSKCFLAERGTRLPSWGVFHRHNEIMQRQDSPGTFPVDVIMAIKMMTARAYHVDYQPHRWGEDIGWSLNCKQAGVTLGWDGGVVSKHVMVPDMLHEIDERAGF